MSDNLPSRLISEKNIKIFINFLLRVSIFLFLIVFLLSGSLFDPRIIILLLFLIISNTILVKVFKTVSFDKLLDYFILSVVAISLFISFLAILSNIVASPFWKWNSSRLAWPLSMFFGYRPYYGLGEGPLLARMYGPASLFLYTPAILGKIPSHAIVIGSMMSALFYFFPVFLIFINKIKENKGQIVPCLYAAAFFLLFTVGFQPLRYVAFNIHVDASAIGFCALACICLYQCTFTRNEWSYFIFASLFIILSIFSKHTLLPILLFSPAYVFVVAGTKAFKKYLLCLVGVGVVSTLALSYFLDIRLLFSEMIFVPMRQSFIGLEPSEIANSFNRFRGEFFWLSGGIIFLLALHTQALKKEKTLFSEKSFRGQQFYLVAASILLLPALAFLSIKAEVISFLFCNKKIKLYLFLAIFYLFLIFVLFLFRWSMRRKKIFCKSQWKIFLLTGVSVFFTSIIALIKAGGDVNNIAPTMYFLSLSIVFVFIEFSLNLEKLIPFLKRAVKILLIILLLTLTKGVMDALPDLFFRLKNFERNIHDVAYRCAMKHPGRIYFPELSLSNLLADRNLYHSLDGISDKLMARFLIDPETFKRNVPKNIEIIAFAPHHDYGSFFLETEEVYSDEDFNIQQRNKQQPWISSALFYYKVRNYKKSEHYFDAYLENNPDDLTSWRVLFDVCKKLGEKRKALICLEEIVRREPLNSEHWVERELLYRQSDFQRFSSGDSLTFPAINAFYGARTKHSDIYVYLMSFFPEFKEIRMSELPGFVVFKRQNKNAEK